MVYQDRVDIAPLKLSIINQLDIANVIIICMHYIFVYHLSGADIRSQSRDSGRATVGALLFGGDLLTEVVSPARHLQHDN